MTIFSVLLAINLNAHRFKFIQRLFLTGKMKMRLLFTSNLIPKVPLQKSITFENCGSTTLRIQFHKQQKFRTFRDIIPHVRISTPFYFNKDEIILLPRQKIDLPIWFKTPKTGHFIESWEMTTSPKLWPDIFIFTISLQGTRMYIIQSRMHFLILNTLCININFILRYRL